MKAMRLPKEWNNPFFDFALLACINGKIILRAFHATVSKAHNMDGHCIQYVSWCLAINVAR